MRSHTHWELEPMHRLVNPVFIESLPEVTIYFWRSRVTLNLRFTHISLTLFKNSTKNSREDILYLSFLLQTTLTTRFKVHWWSCHSKFDKASPETLIQTTRKQILNDKTRNTSQVFQIIDFMCQYSTLTQSWLEDHANLNWLLGSRAVTFS